MKNEQRSNRRDLRDQFEQDLRDRFEQAIKEAKRIAVFNWRQEVSTRLLVLDFMSVEEWHAPALMDPTQIAIIAEFLRP